MLIQREKNNYTDTTRFDEKLKLWNDPGYHYILSPELGVLSVDLK